MPLAKDGVKQCSRCKDFFPATEDHFYASKAHSDRLWSRCKKCAAAEHKAYQQSHPEQERAKAQRYRQKNAEKLRQQSKSPVRQAKMKEWLLLNQERVKQGRLRRYKSLRDEVYAAYGSRCSCCGENDPRFLSIEHIKRDGAAHRRAVGGAGGPMYRFLKKNGFPKDKYTLLCMNCNWATRFGDLCPHQEKKQIAA